jgi:hypothetical protein
MTYHKQPKEVVNDLFMKYGLATGMHREHVEVWINSQRGRATAVEWISPTGKFPGRIETSLHFNYFYKIFQSIDELEKGIVFLMQMEVKL